MSPLLIFNLLIYNSITITLASDTLYDERDNVIPVNNLRTQIYEHGVGKLVQFMNGFSNASQKFVPTYTQLARDLYKWNRILKIYVIDCANGEATDECRKNLIDDTPTLLYFSSDYWMGLGTRVPITDPLKMKELLASHLSELESNVRDQPTFKLLTHKDRVSTVFDVKLYTHLVLVYQPKGSKIGRDTLLDLLPVSKVQVRILEQRSIFKNFGVAEHRYAEANLVVIDRAGKLTHLSVASPRVDDYVFAVEKFVKAPARKTLKEHQPVNIIASLRQRIFDKVVSHQIYLADLERAIEHMLKVQLIQVPVFKGKKLIVLRNVITLLKYLNPLATKEGKLYINHIYFTLANKTEVSGDLFKLISTYSDKSFTGDRYIGCIGSQSGFRGFNCSLWTLFHYLSVAASQAAIYFKPGAVLWALHGYANYFMDCPQCYVNLWFFAQEKKIDDVKTHDEEILWLWEAHNYFNRKLVGDITEDQRFPKQQFPQAEDCIECRNSEAEWRRDKVLKYLKRIYSLEALSSFGLPHWRLFS